MKGEKLGTFPTRAQEELPLAALTGPSDGLRDAALPGEPGGEAETGTAAAAMLTRASASISTTASSGTDAMLDLLVCRRTEGLREGPFFASFCAFCLISSSTAPPLCPTDLRIEGPGAWAVGSDAQVLRAHDAEQLHEALVLIGATRILHLPFAQEHPDDHASQQQAG